MKKSLAIFLVFTTLIVSLTACTNSNNDASTQSEAILGPNANDETVDYAIDMGSFSFTPNQMQASAGQTLKVKVLNKDSNHDLVIDELNVRSKVLNPGESEVIEIKIPADAAGKSYQFYCSVGSHKLFGMTGTLKVLDKES